MQLIKGSSTLRVGFKGRKNSLQSFIDMARETRKLSYVEWMKFLQKLELNLRT
jgi:hypothetical protein